MAARRGLVHREKVPNEVLLQRVPANWTNDDVRDVALRNTPEELREGKDGQDTILYANCWNKMANCPEQWATVRFRTPEAAQALLRKERLLANNVTIFCAPKYQRRDHVSFCRNCRHHHLHSEKACAKQLGKICWKCQETGHTQTQCTGLAKCALCEKINPGHTLAQCPKFEAYRDQCRETIQRLKEMVRVQNQEKQRSLNQIAWEPRPMQGQANDPLARELVAVKEQVRANAKASKEQFDQLTAATDRLAAELKKRCEPAAAEAANKDEDGTNEKLELLMEARERSLREDIMASMKTQMEEALDKQRREMTARMNQMQQKCDAMAEQAAKAAEQHELQIQELKATHAREMKAEREAAAKEKHELKLKLKEAKKRCSTIENLVEESSNVKTLKKAMKEVKPVPTKNKQGARQVKAASASGHGAG